MSTKTELTGLGLRFSDTDTEREFLKFFDFSVHCAISSSDDLGNSPDLHRCARG